MGVTLKGKMQQTLLINAVRYAIGRSTYAPYLTCQILREQMEHIEPTTAAIIAKDIRNFWCDYEGPDAPESSRTAKVYYEMDVGCFVSLLPLLDERSKGCESYGKFIPYLPSRYTRWEHVPKEVRWEGAE